MAYEKKPMTGALFATREKDRKPGYPEATGSFLFNCACGRCTDVQLAALDKVAKRGLKYQKLEERKGQSKPADPDNAPRPGPGVKAPEQRAFVDTEPPGPVGETPEAGDDLPF